MNLGGSWWLEVMPVCGGCQELWQSLMWWKGEYNSHTKCNIYEIYMMHISDNFNVHVSFFQITQ